MKKRTWNNLLNVTSILAISYFFKLVKIFIRKAYFTFSQSVFSKERKYTNENIYCHSQLQQNGSLECQKTNLAKHQVSKRVLTATIPVIEPSHAPQPNAPPPPRITCSQILNYAPSKTAGGGGW